MKSKKRRAEQFLFYDSAGLERHLKEMAAKGWRLSKITRLFWEYRRAEPRAMTYTVTYFSEASDFNPYPTENQRTFYEYCEKAGWQLVTQWAQMQIFCTAEENPTPIETDESVKLNAIHKAMKKNFLPSSILLAILFLFQIFMQLHTIADDPVNLLSNGWALFTAVVSSIGFGYMIINLTGYAAWYFSSRKAVQMGGTCTERGGWYRTVSTIMLVIIFAITVLFLSSQRLGWLGLLGLINITVLIVLVIVIKNALKRVEASRKVNLAVTIVACVILSSLLTGVMVRVVIIGMDAGWFGNRPVETYTTTIANTTFTRDIYNDPMPLTLEDLQEVDYDHYSYRWTVNESFLLALYTGRQDALPGIGHELSYSIVLVKWPALFELCLEDYLNMFNYAHVPELNNRQFRLTNDPAWQADRVYQLFRQDEAEDQYILCWGNRIVHIDFDAPPTTEQISVATKKLNQQLQ